MKTRDFRKFGFELMINARGQSVFVHPLATISDAAASIVTKPQLAEVMRGGIAEAQRSVDKIAKSIAKPETPPV